MVEFVGESAIDDGGPRREYFRWVMKEVQQSNALFQGQENQRVPRHNLQLLSSQQFAYVGRFFALSILQGGPTPAFLAPSVARYLLSGLKELKPSPDEIADGDIREKVQKVWFVGLLICSNSIIILLYSACSFTYYIFVTIKITSCCLYIYIMQISEAKSTEELLDLLHCDSYSFVRDVGYLKPQPVYGDKQDIVRSVALHYVILSVKAELDQIVQGLHEGGLLWTSDEARKLEDIFLYKSGSLTAAQIEDLFPPTMSACGSNRRDAEEEILLHWNYFLKDVQDGLVTITNDESADLTLTLEDILSFATGATNIPLLGFKAEGHMTFLHDGGMFPTASTCSMTLRLPIVTNYEVFKERMSYDILNAHGFFGNV